jgi:hypothetical protein
VCALCSPALQVPFLMNLVIDDLHLYSRSTTASASFTVSASFAAATVTFAASFVACSASASRRNRLREFCDLRLPCPLGRLGPWHERLVEGIPDPLHLLGANACRSVPPALALSADARQ